MYCSSVNEFGLNRVSKLQMALLMSLDSLQNTSVEIYATGAVKSQQCLSLVVRSDKLRLAHFELFWQ